LQTNWQIFIGTSIDYETVQKSSDIKLQDNYNEKRGSFTSKLHESK